MSLPITIIFIIRAGQDHPSGRLSSTSRTHCRLHKSFFSQTCQRLAAPVPRPPYCLLVAAGYQHDHPFSLIALLCRLCVGNGTGSECAQVLIPLRLLFSKLAFMRPGTGHRAFVTIKDDGSGRGGRNVDTIICFKNQSCESFSLQSTAVSPFSRFPIPSPL